MSHARPQIGVFADNLKLPLREGIRVAAQLGAEAFQVYTTSGDLLPANMTAANRAEFRRFFTGLGLTLSATCADFGHGFVDARKNETLIPALYAQVDLAVDLGVGVITTHVGTVPAEHNEVWETMRVALNRIGAYAEKKGVVLATETGPETGAVLRDLLLGLDTAAVRVNLDPANLVMNGYDLDEALDALLPYTVHTHAKDGYCDPGKYREAPLGQGDVLWPHYLARLQAAGYTGALVIEREAGDDPVGDTRAAIQFLRRLL
jgi:L-ribulose-5-phosphate 3-epimerase